MLKSPLDGYKLQMEELPGVAKRLLVNPVLRSKFMQSYQQRLKQAAANRENGVPRFRLFRRLYVLEGKLDKPFLYDSQLLSRIEALEERTFARRTQKRGKK